jgi:hypothetical protein
MLNDSAREFFGRNSSEIIHEKPQSVSVSFSFAVSHNLQAQEIGELIGVPAMTISGQTG